MNKCEPYYIVLCSTCGSFGSHRKCGNIKGADVDKWLCVTCKKVLERSLDLAGPSTSKMSATKASDPGPSTPSSSQSSNLSSSVSNVSTSSHSEPGSSKNGTTKPSKVSRLETVKRQGTKKARSESPKPRSKVSADRIRPESGLKVT